MLTLKFDPLVLRPLNIIYLERGIVFLIRLFLFEMVYFVSKIYSYEITTIIFNICYSGYEQQEF